LALTEIVKRFNAAGGRFITPVEQLSARLDECRAIVFDWDGVFNDGRKGQTTSSGFSEADSMGTNMLRYGLCRRSGALPYSAIISGEDNESAIAFAQREHMTAVYTGIRKKQDVIAHLCEESGLQPQQIACVFDDINDLPMAKMCGLRFMVRRDASPLFADFAESRQICDYITGAGGDSYAVREICELMLGIMDFYSEAVESRTAFDADYEYYFQARQSVTTSCYTGSDLHK
jgi:3-deoxy-D-manno-octulosonate 8-phosphate phosphatase (KDO 8-P phosphatase)